MNEVALLHEKINPSRHAVLQNPVRCLSSAVRRVTTIVVTFSALLCSSGSQAQSAPPADTLNMLQTNTTSGIYPNATVEENSHEQLSLTTGALSFALPVVTLPQRGGRSLHIGFVYQSNVYALKETENLFTKYSPSGISTAYLTPYEETIEWQTTNPRPWNSPLHANLPTLTADLTYAGGAQNPQSDGSSIWTTEYCVQDWVFTDWDGSSHSFQGVRDCAYPYGSPMPVPSLANIIEPSMDDGSYIIDATNASDIKITTKDGTTYHFTGYQAPPQVSEGSTQDLTNLYYYQSVFSSMVDPNGNTVTVTNGSNGWTLTDTVGRTVNIGVQGLSISYEGMDGTSASPVSATIAAGASTGSVQWPYAGQPGPCWAPYEAPPAPQPTLYGPGNMSGNYPATTSSIITLQNGAKYQLTFDTLGHLIEVQYPSGGYTRYDYQQLGANRQTYGDVQCNAYWWPVIAKHECHSASGSCGTQTTYTSWQSCQAGAPAGGEETTCYGGESQPTSWENLDVTDPEGNRTHYDFTVPTVYDQGGALPAYEIDRKIYQGSSTLMRTVTTDYGGVTGSTCPSGLSGLFALFPCKATTTYNDVSPALTSSVSTQYDMNSKIGNPTLIQETDFAGNIVRTTNISWEDTGIYANNQYQSPPVSYPSHILDHVHSKTVTDNVQGKSVTTTNAYDAVGNLQSVTTSGTNSDSYETQYLGALANYGSPTTIKDALENQTTLEYGDSWYDSACVPASNSNAYVTKSTDPMGLITKYSYYSCTGQLATITDPNNQVTTYEYDVLGRKLKQINPSPFGEIDYSYVDTAPLSVTVNSTKDANGSYETKTILDGYGKPVVSQVLSDSNGTLETDTCYDALENKAAVSNPYYASGGTTAPTCNQSGVGYTTYSYLNGGVYDPFGRVQTITHQDGSTSSFQYAGVTTKETDEGNGTTTVQKIIHDDAFGRPVAVCELTNAADAAGASPSSCQWQTQPSGQAAIAVAGTGFLTTYAYDGFGNLTGVTQGNVDRSFTYDGLSRLLTADNPETGTTTYDYELSGALCAASPGSVCSKTDARNSKITYGYNSDNQLTSKTYTNGVTPSVSYSYGPVGTEANNQVGRLISETTTAASTVQSETDINSYDAMGRVTTEKQCVLGSCSDLLTYDWDDLGNLTSETNGVSNPGVQISYFRDNALRLNTVSSTWQDGTHPGTLFSAPSSSYGPDGLMNASYALNNSTQQPGITLARTYDPLRMWVTSDTYTGHIEHTATSGSGSLTISGSEQSKGTPTAANGSVTINGNEQNMQKQTSAATSSTGSITISGSEKSSTTAATHGQATVSVTGYDQYRNGTYDSGYVYFYIDGLSPSVYYSSYSSDSSIASDIASQLNSSGVVTATASGAYITITSVATGSSSNYSWSSSWYSSSGFTSPSFSFSPSSGAMTGGADANTTYDSGTVTALLDGCSASTSYSQSSTASTVASGLASTLSSTCGGIVTASASGSIVSLVSKTTGSGTNWALSTSVSYNSGTFSSASFGASPSGMAGGANAVDTTVYDSGTVAITVNGYGKSTSFGQNDTTSTIAANLAAAINGDGSEPVTASASGSSISLTTKQTGSSVNYSLSASDSYDSGDFSSSSFTALPSGSTLTGGSEANGTPVYDSGTISLTINGAEETVSYGQGDTTSTIASKLASAFSGSSAVSVTASGATLQMASKTTGSATNYSYSVGSSYDSSNFSTSSFTGSPSTGTLSGGTDASDNSTLAYSYSIPSGTGYAPDGDVIGVSDSVMGDWAFSYDAQNRLYSGLAGTGPYNTLNLAWSYDRYGNRWGQTATGNPPTGITMPTPPHFTSNGNASGNVNNHVDGYNYDAAGDVTADSLNQYAYDGEGRLCAAYSGGGVYTEYIYDAEGQRVGKGSATDLSCNPATDNFSLTNFYIIGPTGEQLSEMNGSGHWYHTNVFAGGKLLATYGGTDTYFALTDWLGTKRVETDSAGNTVSTSYSMPFGDNLVVNGSPDATEHHFTGKEHDSDTGNDYFLARSYNSATGRFLSPDWSKNPEGVPYADFTEPQSLNLYNYVLNNPLGSTDPDGHFLDRGQNMCVGNTTSGQSSPACSPQDAQAYKDAAQQQAQQQNASTPSNSSGALTDYASISDWPTGAGGFHHTGIAVDSDDTHGFSTLDPHTPWWKRLFGAPEGAMENDIQHHTKNGEVAPHNYIHIPITAAQAALMRAAIAERTQHPGRYNLIFRNCAGAVESILHTGGVSGIPHSEVNIPVVLHDILLLERGSQ